MSYGKLQFYLFMGEEALPVDDAEIFIIDPKNPGFEEKKLSVDSNGKTVSVSLYTYEKSLSEKPETDITPYKTYDAIIISKSFQNKYIKNIPIFSGVTSIQNVQMTPKVRGGDGIDLIDIPPNGLLLDEYNDTVDNEEELNNESYIKSVPKVLGDVVIPEYITVHLGTPSSYAENVTVTFTDYIKNVASSEIYPTWPKEALKSNIYAEISFT